MSESQGYIWHDQGKAQDGKIQDHVSNNTCAKPVKFADHPLLAHDPVFLSHWFWHKPPSPGNDVCDDERWDIFTLSLHFWDLFQVLWSFLVFQNETLGQLANLDQPVRSQTPLESDLQYPILTPPDNVSEKSEQVDLTVEFECLCEFLYELTSMCEFACILVWSLHVTEMNESESWTAVPQEHKNEPLRCNGKWSELFISPELWTFVTDQVLLIDWTLLSMESMICLRLFLLFMLHSFPETCFKVDVETVHLEGLKPLNTLVFIDDLNPIIVLLTKEFSLVHSANCSALGFGLALGF